MDHFSGLAEYLSSNGFRVVRYDSLDHVGLSTGSIDEFTMTVGKQSLLAVVRWLNDKNIYDIGLVAASLAARIAYEIISEVRLSFLITAVGVVNLRDTLKRALGLDYLNFPIGELPDDLEFEGHRLGAKAFVHDCYAHRWQDFSSTVQNVRGLCAPFITFIASNDSWVKKEEVFEMLSNISSDYKVYSFFGASHNLGGNFVALRSFYQSITKAAIALEKGSLNLDADIYEPKFEQITVTTVNERRMRAQIENQSLAVS
uniref:Acyl transferase n=1 Tax=Candidatus Photodesmus blepharonis TaxID=1179155 RepID=M9NLN8_9GAMM|nr:acyl transferase [Candidatus Photodesmus blepharus]